MKEYIELLIWSIAANFGVKPGQYISDEELEEMEAEFNEVDDVADYYYHLSGEFLQEIKSKRYALNIAIAAVIALATLSACLISIAWELL